MAEPTTYVEGPDVPDDEELRDSHGRLVDETYVDEAVADAVRRRRGRPHDPPGGDGGQPADQLELQRVTAHPGEPERDDHVGGPERTGSFREEVGHGRGGDVARPEVGQHPGERRLGAVDVEESVGVAAADLAEGQPVERVRATAGGQGCPPNLARTPRSPG